MIRVPGIPDGLFVRDESIPMTKEEIRVLALSKAGLFRGARFLDVGSGTGSVTVEAALFVGEEGVVYAVDKDRRAVELTRRNVEKFGLRNVRLIEGDAVEVVPRLEESFDAAFVGGGSENIEAILEAVYSKLKAGGRLVVDAIMLDTAYRAIKALEELGAAEVEVVEVMVAKGMRVRHGVVMLARNPIFIIRGVKHA